MWKLHLTRLSGQCTVLFARMTSSTYPIVVSGANFHALHDNPPLQAIEPNWYKGWPKCEYDHTLSELKSALQMLFGGINVLLRQALRQHSRLPRVSLF